MTDTVKLRARRIPAAEALVQPDGRPAVASAAGAASGNAQAGGTRRSRAALSDVADHARRSRPSARSRFPTGPRRVPAVAAEPAYRARRLEKALQTPARIYYKYEGVSPAGSHKPNTAVAQAFYNKEAGVRRSRPRPAPASGVRRWRSRARSSASRSRLHGARVVRPEAVSSRVHGDLRRALHREPVDGDQLRPASAGARRPTATAASASRSPRRSKSPPATATPTTRSVRC